MKHIPAALIFCLAAAGAYAGCAESGQQCVFYKNGNVAAEGACSVNKCTENGSETQIWKLKNGQSVRIDTDKNGRISVNKKPGRKAQNSNAAAMGLTCYAADAAARSHFCATSY